MPVAIGRPTSGSILPICRGDDDAGAMTGVSFGRTTSSTSVFHWPHDAHCPAHLACAAPQSVHTCSIRVFAMLRVFALRQAGFHDGKRRLTGGEGRFGYLLQPRDAARVIQMFMRDEQQFDIFRLETQLADIVGNAVGGFIGCAIDQEMAF